MNFMEATTIIEDLAEKRKSIYKKVAGTMSEVLLSKNTLDDVGKFLNNALSEFSSEEKVKILIYLVENLLLNKGYSSGKNNEKKARSSRYTDFFE